MDQFSLLQYISHLDPSVVAAFIALIGVVITVSVGWVVDNRKLQNEKEQRKVESLRHENEVERLQMEQIQSARQADYWKSEVEKNKVETRRLSYQIEQIRNQPFQLQQSEIRELINIFGQSSLGSLPQNSDPVEIFHSMRKTLRSLNKRGIFLIHDSQINSNLNEIKEILLGTEAKVRKHCPNLIRFANELDKGPEELVEKRLKWLAELNQEFRCGEIISVVVENYRKIRKCVETIQKRFQTLDQKKNN